MSKDCPICGKPAHVEYTPFCGKGCQSIDLNRWLSEGYAIPAVEEPDEDDLGDEQSLH